MNWSRVDLLFSLRHYVAETLGPPWTLRFERFEITNDERPTGLLDLGPSRVTRSRTAVPQGNVERAAPLTVTLYPPVGSSPRAGRVEAERVAERLDLLVSAGLDLGPNQYGRPVAGPFRVPVYDYDDGRTPSYAAEDPYDVLWVDEDANVRAIQDPDDAKRWAVILEATLSWEAAGRTYAPGDEGPIVRSVPGAFNPPPSEVSRDLAAVGAIASGEAWGSPTVVRL